MHLTELTISGFKSFGKTTTFTFPTSIVAVVGPNGSGKSNVAEAIRWVIGEQSMKILRGKRGEDLIFNGGGTSQGRLGKASVSLTFENRDRRVPVDFDEVTLERKIFRDGTNEYRLNNSPVRLKDIVELMARLGLGETKHNIIGQGEVDRILLATPRDRRSMLEEAIGLRIYQLRKRESERKLEEVSENMREVSSLLREIAPHLKFLKAQADKAERHETVRQEWESSLRAFVQIESPAIAEEEKQLTDKERAATKDLGALEGEIASVMAVVESPRANETGKTKSGEERERLEYRRREIERELGRIEGRIEALLGNGAEAQHQKIDRALFDHAITPIREDLKKGLKEDDPASLHKRIERVLSLLDIAAQSLFQGSRSDTSKEETNAREALERERDVLAVELTKLQADLENAEEAFRKERETIRNIESTIKERFQDLREKEELRMRLRTELQKIEFERERLRDRKKVLNDLVAESGHDEKELLRDALPQDTLPAPELRAKIERLKARLEEIGGIDTTVLKEFEETKSRHEFLERELHDLERATGDLSNLIKELDDRIERDFKAGVAKIQKEFDSYFKIIFGGGHAEMRFVELKTRGDGDDEEVAEEEAEEQYGVEIDVDIPRKRIKSLAMLSGGERALVSIALLFALTSVNPPPFLILDETDAALDEANSQKYAAILEELAKKSQLVVITHNRETMKHAGVLYGVTMGEDGVSRLISLKLEEASIYGNR